MTLRVSQLNQPAGLELKGKGLHPFRREAKFAIQLHPFRREGAVQYLMMQTPAADFGVDPEVEDVAMP